MNAAFDNLPALDPDQIKAIRRLERALKACRETDIEIRGQGNCLVATNARNWSDVDPGGGLGGELLPTYDVQDHGAYIDSGADDMLHGTLTPRGQRALEKMMEEHDETEKA